jgi:hypothetical protein
MGQGCPAGYCLHLELGQLLAAPLLGAEGSTLLHGHYRLLDSVRYNAIKSKCEKGGILQ